MKKLINKFKTFIYSSLRLMGYRINKIGPYSIFDFESFLYRHLAVHKSLTFLQIGANDGVMNDPIYNFNMDNKSLVSGYVLEPLPDIYSMLKKNYKSSPKIKTFNLAIHATEAEMILHRVKPCFAAKVPIFARGIASFDNSHWKKTTLIPSSDYMEQVNVKCVTFASFIMEHSIEKLDLLLIDTEGYDFEILMSINFEQLKPKIIRFEHGIRNNIMPLNKFVTVCNHLNSQGYQVIAESYDATAYLLDPADLVFST